MNRKKYEDDGNYAAQVDFNVSPGYLLDSIIGAYEAAASTAVTDTFDSSNSWKWGLDYLETGLELLGFQEVAALVKTDFTKSTSVFAEELKERGLPASSS